MSKLETVVEELKALSPDRLEQAAEFIHRLQTVSRANRNAALRSTAGVLTGKRGEEFAGDIEAGCEQVDERNW